MTFKQQEIGIQSDVDLGIFTSRFSYREMCEWLRGAERVMIAIDFDGDFFDVLTIFF